ncbi:MAG: hybrid sensor histidine kinase/response regulator [Methanoregula sp.]|nr:hybrid sensor histidine kinase/response regulator [Methanoregula sp.]
MTGTIRVLYVDDEPSLLDIGKLFLEMDGTFAVDTFTSVSEALTQLKMERYDAILSDYQMPEMDGITFLKQIRASQNRTPFIIFTGRGREDVVIEALNNGADFYIQKGGEPKSQYAELSNKIRYAVSKKHSEEALGESELLEKEMEYHEKELMKYYNQTLDDANKKLTLLSGITRHDIISQLTALQLYLEILENKLPDSSYHEYFKKIGIATDRIYSIVRFTQEYETIGVNTPVWVDVSAIVDAAKKEGVSAHLQLVNDLPANFEVFSDALIANVCYNLIDNAVRYGGKITMIRFSVEDAGDYHRIVCEDDGNGVVAEEKEKIFTRGFGKNTGLGLALSREILLITGITIKENGEPGKGARFDIVVPDGAWRIGGRED